MAQALTSTMTQTLTTSYSKVITLNRPQPIFRLAPMPTHSPAHSIKFLNTAGLTISSLMSSIPLAVTFPLGTTSPGGSFPTS